MSTALSASQQQSIVPIPQDEGPDWKRQLVERLDAYRAKHPEVTPSPSSASNTLTDSRASRIARSVASRYAAAPTYSELLLAAARAEQAAAKAQAALAERIAQDARVAEELAAQEKIVREQHSPITLGQQESLSSADGEQTTAGPEASAVRIQPGTPVMPQFAARTREMHLHQATPEPEPSLEDLWASALVEPRELLPSKLIEFPRELVSSRRARPRLPENPVREPGPVAPQPEPAQLRIFEVQPEAESAVEAKVNAQTGTPVSAPDIDLPSSEIVDQNISDQDRSKDALQISPPDSSQDLSPDSTLVVANTQYAATNHNGINHPASPSPSQSRTVVSTPPRAEAPSGHAANSSAARAFKRLEWAAISLDKGPAASSRPLESSVVDYVPFLVDPASIDRRLMAFAVDFAAVTAGFLGFLVVFAASTPHLPTGFTAVALAGAVYTSLWVLYQMLFFSLSGATAGMLYARIALCTFDDQNPSRPALRRRLAAWWLSCLPLGLGFLWCFVDEDNLSWHDRITRMYQREY